MAENTIGQFIAALRKANGLTQQDVADRLNVSNKAVSRWERDECAPDLSVIPALAEMFGVTCDELLKGKRITEPTSSERKEPTDFGLQYNLLRSVDKVVFGVSWATDYEGASDCRTWFAADPTITIR